MTTPHVMVVAMENHSYNNTAAKYVKGNPALPYINSLMTNYGYCTKFYGCIHPSLGNYVGFACGDDHNIRDDGYNPATSPIAGNTLVDQLNTAGIAWKHYAEHLPSTGYLGGDSGSYPNQYTQHHNPWVYFSTVRTTSSQYNRIVNYSDASVGLAHDLTAGAAPPFCFVQPGNEHNGHTGSDAATDSWTQTFLTMVQASSWYTGNSGIVILWWDESNPDADATGFGDAPPPAGGHTNCIVVSAQNSGTTLTTNLNHYGMLRALETLYGLAYLNNAAHTTNGDLSPLLGVGSPPGTLTASPNTLQFSGVQGGADPGNQSVVVTNTAATSAAYTTSSSAAWLTVSPTSGTIAASGGTATFTIMASTSSLSPGTYTGTITWTSGALVTSVLVTLVVSSSGGGGGGGGGGAMSPYGVTVPIFGTQLYQFSSQLFADCPTLHIGRIRFQQSWSLIEGSPGVYNWSALDDFVGRCNAAGIAVAFPIRTAPSWHNTTLVNPSQTNRTTCNSKWPNDKIYNMDATATGVFAGILATRYNGKTTPNAHKAGSFLFLDAIEIGNEDFDYHFDCNSPVTIAGQEPRLCKWYAPVVFAAAPAIKRASPTTAIGMFGMWWSHIDHRTSFLNDLYTLKDSGGKSAASYLDYFNFHCYIGEPNTDNTSEDVSLPHILTALGAVVSSHGDNTHFRITEIGWSAREFTGQTGDPTEAMIATYYHTAMEDMRTSGIVDGFDLFSMAYQTTGAIVPAGKSITQPAGLTPHFWPAAFTIQSYAAQFPTWGASGVAGQLSANPTSLSFTAIAGGTNPAAQHVVVSNSDTASAAYTDSDTAPWLTVSPTSGTIAASGSASFTVSVNTSGLVAGTYTGTITWTSGTMSTFVSVTLSVTPSVPPPPPGALTACFAAEPSALLPTACKLYAAPGSPAVTTVTILLGTATGWGELITQGTAQPWAAAPDEGGPSDYGFLWESVALAGNSLRAGTYTAALTLSMTGAGAVTITADLHVRLWQWNATGGYDAAPIVEAVLAGQAITTTPTLFSPSATTTSPTAFDVGDKLYIDIKIKVTANAGPATAYFLLSDLSLDASGMTGSPAAAVVTPGYSPTIGPPPPPPPAALTLYGSDIADATLPTACDMGKEG